MSDNDKAPILVLSGDAPAEPTLDPATIHEAVQTMDRPRFDLEGLSWGDSMAIGTIGSRITAVQMGAEVTADQLMTLMDELIGHLAHTVTFVPSSYLVRGAPERIDWSQPESFRKYIKTRKAMLLVQALAEALNAPDPLDSTPA